MEIRNKCSINNEFSMTMVTQGSHRLEKYLNIQYCLEKSLEIKFALKTTRKTFKGLEFYHLQEDSTLFFGGLNQYKIGCLYLVQHMLHQVKAPQFYTDFLKLIS